MKTIALELDALLGSYLPRLNSISDEAASVRPAPGKWSKKEILGHLVDSAQNNIRRFIVARYEETPQIVYRQDAWVSAHQYNDYAWKELIQLWQLQNKQLVSLIRNASSEVAERTVQTESLHTVAWLASDYIRHLQHHLHQVLELEPVAYP